MFLVSARRIFYVSLVELVSNYVAQEIAFDYELQETRARLARRQLDDAAALGRGDERRRAAVGPGNEPERRQAQHSGQTAGHAPKRTDRVALPIDDPEPEPALGKGLSAQGAGDGGVGGAQGHEQDEGRPDDVDTLYLIMPMRL